LIKPDYLVIQQTLPSQENGNVTFMTLSPFGIVKEIKWIVFIKQQANTFHPTIKFTSEISENEITFLDTVVFKGERNIEKSILDIETHYYRPTETFQYTHFSSCHPPGAKRGFIKGEALRLLRTTSSKATFAECLANFKRSFEARKYPKKYIGKSLS